ncbi:hypothetical protein [Clostridium sp. AM58-1XD]|uniref:hypothetical protein n=1 Tax=Clostridium sp. AM58-1XD TaxID=2292307 RepID=UPI000E46A535|nr:hypothetical protein [Clostridium sp. AM58-1XD]RGY95764.1 hypothetical protein DXA13_18440 [Clostridium sp. AM58-1XD]
MITFQLAVAGDLPDDQKIYQQIDELIGQIKGYLFLEKSGKGSAIRMLASPAYTESRWKDRAKLGDFPLQVCCLDKAVEEWSGECESLVRLDSPLRSIAGEWLCSQSDLLLIVWNESLTEFKGATWELIQMAHRKKTPCVWISSETNQIYWSQETYFDKYGPNRLRNLCESLNSEEVKPNCQTGERSPLIDLGARLQQNFLRKHKAQAGKMPADFDILLKEGFDFSDQDSVKKEVHIALLRQFQKFDQSAIELSDRYRAVIYWRAILPMITTVFLAIGFYAETLFSYAYLPAAGISPWAVLAGAGFLVHGLLNLYVYGLSRDKKVQQWHQGFLNDRYIAEMFRVFLHFIPYGVSLDIRKLSGKNREIYNLARGVIREVHPCSMNVDQKDTEELLNHVSEMLKDQVAYHQESAARYGRVADSLEKWNKWIFSIGFVVVILRAVLQFAIVYMPLSGSSNGISTTSFVRSFANMAALLLPAWASYFSSKLGQCNYRYHSRNHERMGAQLSEELDRVQQLQDLEHGVPLEIINTVAEELAEIMLVEDTSAWYDKISASAVTKM